MSEHVNCEHDPEGADGNPFAAMVCAPTTESTSARLRQVQADLAASQADLTQALGERDDLLARLALVPQTAEEIRAWVVRHALPGYVTTYGLMFAALRRDLLPNPTSAEEDR